VGRGGDEAPGAARRLAARPPGTRHPLHRLGEFGLDLTHDDKALILGGNYARIIGLDVEAAKAAIADDEFARERAATGLQEPHSNWRAELAMAVA